MQQCLAPVVQAALCPPPCHLCRIPCAAPSQPKGAPSKSSPPPLLPPSLPPPLPHPSLPPASPGYQQFKNFPAVSHPAIPRAFFCRECHWWNGATMCDVHVNNYVNRIFIRLRRRFVLLQCINTGTEILCFTITRHHHCHDRVARWHCQCGTVA